MRVEPFSHRNGVCRPYVVITALIPVDRSIGCNMYLYEAIIINLISTKKNSLHNRARPIFASHSMSVRG